MKWPFGLNWKRSNYLALIALTIWGAVDLYNELLPIYIDIGPLPFIRGSAYGYLTISFILVLLFSVLYLVIKENIPFLRVIRHSLILPVIILPLMMIGEKSSGYVLLFILFASFISQRVNWKEVRIWLMDLRVSFSPYLKEGYEAFLDCRSSRKSI